VSHKKLFRACAPSQNGRFSLIPQRQRLIAGFPVKSHSRPSASFSTMCPSTRSGPLGRTVICTVASDIFNSSIRTSSIAAPPQPPRCSETGLRGNTSVPPAVVRAHCIKAQREIPREEQTLASRKAVTNIPRAFVCNNGCDNKSRCERIRGSLACSRYSPFRAFLARPTPDSGLDICSYGPTTKASPSTALSP